jgi:pimeloyl-ACP methyl ester carboxylesterase
MRRFTILVLLTLCWAAFAKAQDRVTLSADDGAQIVADLYGSGTRGVVLAHGGRFNKESWKPQAQALARSGFHVLAFDFRGFGQSHGPGEKDMFTAPVQLDVLAAVHYLRQHGARTVSVVGASFGGGAAAAACVAESGAIDRLALLAAEPDAPADKVRVPLLFIVGRDDSSGAGPRLPRIQAWFNKARQPKKLVVVDSAEHAQFLFQTEHGDLVMREITTFLKSGSPRRKR